MTPERRTHLIITSLRLRAVTEAHLHYGRDLTKGIAGELSELADTIEAEALPASSTEDWLPCDT